MRAWFVLPLLLASASAVAEDWQFGGHIKYQFSRGAYDTDDVVAVYADRTPADHDLDLRLKAEKRGGPWEFVAHYELLALYGDSQAARNKFAAAGYPVPWQGPGLPQDERRLMDLSREITDGEQYQAVQRLDRLSLGYLSERGVLRLGRQAISWGNGLVFNPLDFVNPFSPIAIDKEYKTGDDMLYGQWILMERSDLQGILLPRRDPENGNVEGDQGSAALKWRRAIGGTDMDVILARHYGENLAGLGLVHDLGGAVARMDLAATHVMTGDYVVSLDVNADYSWVAWGKNMYGYVEYYHNGFGEADPANYLNPSPALYERLLRGELFTVGRDYLAGGLQVELAPLFNLYSGLILNLRDQGGYLQLRGVYDVAQNVQLTAGLNLPFGGRGTEYGGVPVTVGGPYVAPPRSLYVRVGYYF